MQRKQTPVRQTAYRRSTKARSVPSCSTAPIYNARYSLRRRRTNAELTARHYGTIDAFVAGMEAAGKGLKARPLAELTTIGAASVMLSRWRLSSFKEPHNRSRW